MSTIQTRSIAVMKLPASVPLLIKFAAAFNAAVTGNAFFPGAAAVIAALAKALAALDGAETATRTRTRGTVAARNAARAALVVQLHALRALVQTAADADPEHAAAMIASAGLLVRKTPSRTKAPFTARQGTTSGTVELLARSAGRRASYEWQWSADGGKTWTSLAPSLQARTTAPGVPAGTSCLFRFRGVTKAGPGDWSQAATLLVK